MITSLELNWFNPTIKLYSHKKVPYAVKFTDSIKDNMQVIRGS
jgi:hypothetical protein